MRFYNTTFSRGFVEEYNFHEILLKSNGNAHNNRENHLNRTKKKNIFAINVFFSFFLVVKQFN